MHEYGEKLNLIRSSNCRILKSLNSLRSSVKAFEDICSKLDMTVESPLIYGDTYHKPIAYFMELVSDLFKYMHGWLLKVKYSAHLMEPTDLKCIDDYKILLEPSEDFEEYLYVGLTYCKCLRPKQPCEPPKPTCCPDARRKKDVIE